MPPVNEKPLVTVIFPVFNGERFLDAALRSARSQSYRNLEILVVDDGSTDGSRDIVRRHEETDPRVRLIVQPNAGVARARNHALAQARGTFVAPLDADDLWAPEKVELQVQRLLEAGEDTAFVYGWWVWIDEKGEILDHSPHWKIEGSSLEQLLVINFTGSASGPMFRRRYLQELGGYDEELAREGAGGCEDLDVVLRLAERFRIAVVPRVLLGYRRSSGTMSTAVERMRRSHERVLDGLRHRRPDLLPSLFLVSSRVFAMYLAGVSFSSGKRREALTWALRSSITLSMQVAPYVLRMLLLPKPRSCPALMSPGISLETARLPRPWVPYHRFRLFRSQSPVRLNAPPALRQRLQQVAQECLLLPFRAEALSRRWPRRRPRVLAMACWQFPIYSQTFVYRELLALAKAGYTLRFAYGAITSRGQLPAECKPLWRLRRRIFLSDTTATRDLRHFQRRMPEQVNALLHSLSEATGLSKAELLAHRHVRHAFSFSRVAEIWKPDYIHTYFFYEAALFGYFASTLLGIPRGVSCYADHMMDDYELKAVKLHLASASVVVATSARIKQELEAIAGKELPAAVVKPNGIDAGLFHRSERDVGDSPPVMRVIAVNRLHPKKGCMYLLEAARTLRDEGLPMVVEILGEPDAHDPDSAAYLGEMNTFIAAHQLGKSIVLRGRQTAQQVRRRLQESDIFVAPFVELPNGDKDGIPTALLEAMAAGCAVVSTDAGSIREVFEDGVEGLRVPQRDSMALSFAIRRLASDRGLRKSLGEAAVRRVQQHFDVSRCEETLHRRIRSLLSAWSPRLEISRTQ